VQTTIRSSSTSALVPRFVNLISDPVYRRCKAARSSGWQSAGRGRCCRLATRCQGQALRGCGKVEPGQGWPLVLKLWAACCARGSSQTKIRARVHFELSSTHRVQISFQRVGSCKATLMLFWMPKAGRWCGMQGGREDGVAIMRSGENWASCSMQAREFLQSRQRKRGKFRASLVSAWVLSRARGERLRVMLISYQLCQGERRTR
jgi:hypothetical protein